MKPVKMKRPTFAPNVSNGVPTHAVSAAEAFVPESKKEPPLPPPPPQMTAPVGPPPVAAELPTDYEGFVELAKKVSRGAMTDKALLWANLAQAAAQNRIADQLDELLEFLGARDEVEDDYIPDFSDQIAAGILSAVEVSKNGFLGALPPELMQKIKEVIAVRMAEAIGEMNAPDGLFRPPAKKD